MSNQELSNRIDALLNKAKINELAISDSWGEIAQRIEDSYNDLKGFAEACYDQNSVNELAECLSAEADQGDMETWDIDAEEWKEAIEQALFAKAFDNDLHETLREAEAEWFRDEESNLA